MRRSFRFSLLALVLLAAPQCRILFWSDRHQWLPASWIDESRLLEARHDYEAKLSWYPLNQNELSRSVETRVYLHELAGQQVISTREIARYDGWTLAGSLRVAGSHFFAIRGAAREMGAGPRELVSFACCDAAEVQTTPRTRIAAEKNLIAAAPAPDGLQVVLIETNAEEGAETGGDLHFRFLSVSERGFELVARARLYYAGAPGLPEYRWAADGAGLYVRDSQSSVKFVAVDGVVRDAVTFPACFRPTGDASPRGSLWLRSYDPELDPPDNLVEGVAIQAGAATLPVNADAMISQADRIGEGCP